VGAELRNDGIMAIVYALGFILLYIAVRFDLAFAPGAVLALIHDVLITVGVFSLLQLEFNLPVIAAILAIVGYSLNDTIVVYDRIRENSLRYRGRTLRDLVNTSLNQTLSRTLLTSATTMLVVLALLIVGGGIIRDFSIALTVGVMVGTYSSVAIASPAYIFLRERAEKKVSSSKGKSAAATA
jgi:preprotein translocase subunit SecF